MTARISMRSARSGVAKTRGLGLALAIVLTPMVASAATLKIDHDHSAVSFRVRHLFTKVTGNFRKFDGTVDFDPKNIAASKVSATIDAASIDTNVKGRDDDLRSKRFFDVEKFPTLTFKSTSVKDVSGNTMKVVGLLTMHGVEKEVTLAAEHLGTGKDPWGNVRSSFHAETKVNRKDFGMTWNEAIEAGGVLVGDEIDIMLDIEALPEKPADKPAEKPTVTK